MIFYNEDKQLFFNIKEKININMCESWKDCSDHNEWDNEILEDDGSSRTTIIDCMWKEGFLGPLR